MAVIFDTLVFRPDIGVHRLSSPADAARVRRAWTSNGPAARPAPQSVRPHLLEARWTVGGDGHLGCSWITVSPA